MMVKLDPEIYNALKKEGLRAAAKNVNKPRCTCARCTTGNININRNRVVINSILKIEKGV